MSRTYDIACEQCKKALWIGQVGAGRERGYIYKTDEAMEALDKFLWDHEGHPLQFVDDQLLSEDFEEIGR